MRLEAAGLTDVGCVRKHNEDNLLVDPGMGLFMVADGLGGHAAGEVASQIVVDKVAQFVAQMREKDRTWPLAYDTSLSFDGNRLKVALLLSDQAIAEDIRQHPERETMGSTVVAALLHHRRVTLAHVGDSRAYLINEGGIRQMTQDHSWVAEQVAHGVLTQAEARIHPFRNVITQALGNGGELEIELQEFELQDSDQLLLCTDGLSGKVGDQEIWNIVKNAQSLQEAVDRLIHMARENGGEDNITAVLVRLAPGDSAAN